MSHAVEFLSKNPESPYFQPESSKFQTSLKTSKLFKNVPKPSWSEWRLSLQEIVSKIGTTDPEKASDISRRLLGFKGTKDQKDQLEKFGIEVPDTFDMPGLLGGVIGEEVLAIALLKGAVTLLMKGSKDDLKEKLDPQILHEAVIQLANGEEVIGQHEGGRIIKKGKRSVKNWGRKTCQFVAYGKGKFTSDRITYMGDFVDGLFHDLTGEARLFTKELRYTGCFDKGKKCGHGTLEKYDPQKGDFYSYYKGTWEEDLPKDGTYYFSEDRQIAKVRNGIIQEEENGTSSKRNQQIEAEEEKAPQKPLQEQERRFQEIQETLQKEEEVKLDPRLEKEYAQKLQASEQEKSVIIKELQAQQAQRVQELKAAKESVEIFGKADWDRLFGVVEDVPFPANIEEIMQSPCPIWEGKRVADTHLLTLIPKTVDGLPLTLDKLGEIIQRPKGGGYATKYEKYYNDVKKTFGNKPSSRSYWALMTKDVLPGSKGKRYRDQLEMIEKNLGMDYGPPPVLGGAVSILMHHAKTGERLYSDKQCTYTRCLETNRTIVGSYREMRRRSGKSVLPSKYNIKMEGRKEGTCVVLGFFSAGGLHISSLSCGNPDGIAVFRKFF